MQYGLSYYTGEGGVRTPQSGLQVRLVRPGGEWDTGIDLIEKEQTGYYEVDIEDEADQGYYEIWDNRTSPAGSFSGRTVTIGQLDARGLQNRCIYTNHIDNSVITGQKIAAGAIDSSHLQKGSISILNLKYHISNQHQGVGHPSGKTPPEATDNSATHAIPGTYSSIPIVLLTPRCNKMIWIEEVALSSSQLTIKVGFGKSEPATDLRYEIVILS